MAAHLQYLLRPLKVVALKKIPFSNTENPKTVDPLTAHDKHYLLKRDNLAQPIQIQ